MEYETVVIWIYLLINFLDIFKKTPFDNHNKYTIDKHYSKHFEDIIYNPDNHFYYLQ